MALHTADDAGRTAAKLPLTVVIPTLDEGAQIGDAVGALQWADEVIVVDGGSGDGTRDEAAKAGATVIDLRGSSIGGQRNAGIAAARNDWILALDADERVSPALIAEIQAALAAPTFDAYRIRFRNFYLGRELRYGHWGRDWHVRLFRRRFNFTASRVHERLQGPRQVGTLQANIIHRPYRDVDHHIRKILVYARWGAEDLHERGREAGLWELGVRPAWRFWREFIGYRAYREGRLGLLLAGLSAMAAFLKYALLYARRSGSRET